MNTLLGCFFIMNSEEPKKITGNRQKKMDIVTILSGNFAKAKAVVFTNYQGLTHKQIEDIKKAIKPLEAEYVVAKNSLVTIALKDNNITLSEDLTLKGPTGTMFLYGDVVTPLKSLAKSIKELNLPSVKFGIMEKDFITGEQVMKLSTLPSRETLLTQIAVGLKSPISGLHRALSWNLQKFVMTLNAIATAKPALAVATAPAPAASEPVASEPVAEPAVSEAPTQEPAVEPETILAETPEEKAAEVPVDAAPGPATEEKPAEEVKIEGGEN